MNIAVKRMNVDEFLAWCGQQERGRYELVDGQVVSMNAQQLRHINVKYAVHAALKSALEGRSAHVVGDGMAVRIDGSTVYEPDALVYAGEPLAPETVMICDPVVVVEILSPGTKTVDTTKKLEGYFKLASVRHSLIVDPEARTVVHHARKEAGAIATQVLDDGEIELDAIGARVSLARCFAS